MIREATKLPRADEELMQDPPDGAPLSVAAAALPAAAVARLLSRLERDHGIGARGQGAPGWLMARVDRVLRWPELAKALASGGVEAALDALLSSPLLVTRLADELRVGETRFYRDPAQWDALRTWFREGTNGSGGLSALSAGCSTGEEAWTLAMLLSDVGRAGKIVALDRSQAALEIARQGRYPSAAVVGLPEAYQRKYLLQDGDHVRVDPNLRVSFVERDLMRGLPVGTWDVILCKNVLIYFGEEAGRRVAGQLIDALRPDGLLLVARSEVSRLRGLGFDTLDIAPGVPAFRRG